MLSSATQRLLLAHLFALGVAAHNGWLLALPTCWQTCLSRTDDGCTSTRCICKTTASSASYLADAVSCAASQCNADEWALDLVLGPLELYCAAIYCPIPDQVMESASAAATATTVPPQMTPTAQSSATSKQSEHQTTLGSDDGGDLTSTIKSTMTKTTTDNDGNTLQVIVPIVVGPTAISTGNVITSTLAGRASSTKSLALTLVPSSTHSSSSTLAGGSRETGQPANGNGSPFENMQAGASRWTISRPLLGFGVPAILFMRL